MIVADARVALQWFLRDAPGEDHQSLALGVLEQAVAGQVQLWQPPHFLADVSAVLARAVTVAVQLQHHLLDILYHAVALQTAGAVCITADRRYLDTARTLGQLVWLGEYQLA